MASISWTTIFLGILIIFLSGTIQGLTSFGFSLLAVPLLTLFLPLKLIVPMLVMYSLLMNSMILYKLREHMNIKRISGLVIAGILGTPFGAYLLIVLDEKTLQIIVGMIVTLSALAMMSGYHASIKNEKLANVPIGFMSGLLNGSVSLSGPPIILFLANQDLKKEVFRANLTTYFWILNLITIPTFIKGGLITKDVMTLSATLLPALIVGVGLGITFSEKIDEKLFKKITLVLVIIMGMLSIVSGAIG